MTSLADALGGRSLRAFTQRRARAKELGICGECGGAKLHKMGCSLYADLVTVPGPLARVMKGRVTKAAFAGFHDGSNGVPL